MHYFPGVLVKIKSNLSRSWILTFSLGLAERGTIWYFQYVFIQVIPIGFVLVPFLFSFKDIKNIKSDIKIKESISEIRSF